MDESKEIYKIRLLDPVYDEILLDNKLENNFNNIRITIPKNNKVNISKKTHGIHLLNPTYDNTIHEALIEAINNKNNKEVETILYYRDEIDKKEALNLAFERGYKEIIYTLIKYGARTDNPRILEFAIEYAIDKIRKIKNK